MPTQQRLQELFDYRDGHLYAKSYSRGRKKNKPIGGSGHRGYRYTGYNYKYYAVHRFIWVWHYGAIPPGMQIDHVDRNRLNNRIENLRLVTSSQNARNRSVYSRHPTGALGVKKCGKKFYATIGLGTFDTFEEAVAMRRAAEKWLSEV